MTKFEALARLEETNGDLFGSADKIANDLDEYFIIRTFAGDSTNQYIGRVADDE